MPVVSSNCTERYRLISWLCARHAVTETVTTRVRLAMSPEAVWRHIMFYEEVPTRPGFLLRTLLPYPIRTEGPKNAVGALVRCAYRGGDLVKRITAIEAPHWLEFDVVEQRLGIERCLKTYGGSYRIERCGPETDVVLRTTYHAYLRPRQLWRRLETVLIQQLHTHILHGIEGAVGIHDRPVCGSAKEMGEHM